MTDVLRSIEQQTEGEDLGCETARADFLRFVKSKYGKKLHQVCEGLVRTSAGKDLNSFIILQRAKLQLDEPILRDLASMNSEPFGSASH